MIIFPVKGEIHNILIQKLNDSLVAEIPRLTRREIRLPAVPGQALAVIGMRRSGKTCFLSQCMADLLAAGAPRESLVLLMSATLQREVRSLIEAKAQHPNVRTQLILLDPLPPGTSVPATVELTPAIPWFLEAPES